MKDEIKQLDDEFMARVAGRPGITPTNVREDSREYWNRVSQIQENNARKALEAEIDATVDSVMTPRGVFVKNLGQQFYWLRPRSDRGLEFRLLLELEKKLPQGKGIVRILEKNKGFVIVIG